MQLNDLSDKTLLELMQEGNALAFEVIYKKYWRQLYGFVYQQIGSREDTEEIIQELMTSLWQNRAISEIRNLNAFLFISARNLINRYIRNQINLRKYQEYKLMKDVYDGINIEENFNATQLMDSIEKTLANLPEKTATIFRLSKMDKLPVKVIASKMGLSDKAVEYHITKSLKVLREQLKGFHLDN